MSDLVDDLLAKGDPEGPDFESDVLERLSSLRVDIEHMEAMQRLRLSAQEDLLKEVRATQLRHGEALQRLAAKSF